MPTIGSTHTSCVYIHYSCIQHVYNVPGTVVGIKNKSVRGLGRWQRSRGTSSFLLTNASRIHLQMEQFSQSTC